MDARERLDVVLTHFERLGLGAGQGFSCDGGAAALSDMLEAAEVPHLFAIGLYHWPEAMMDVRRVMIDDPEEHHHWIEALGLIIDPNGEIRGEPRVQPAGNERYQASDDWDVLQFSPYLETTAGDDWEVVEADLLAVMQESALYQEALARYLAERDAIRAELQALSRPRVGDLAAQPLAPAPAAPTAGDRLEL